MNEWNQVFKCLGNILKIRSYQIIVCCGLTYDAQPSDITCFKPGWAAESALTEIENIWHSLHTSSAEISENLNTENNMLWEEIPELLVDCDETKTNNTNFEPPPEPLYCKLCEPDEKKPASLFCKICDCNLCDTLSSPFMRFLSPNKNRIMQE